MGVGLITTLRTNIGDDLVRAGIVSLLNEVLPARERSWLCINKHHPLQAYPAWHPLRWFDLAPAGRVRLGNAASTLLHGIGHSRLDACSVIVYCGTPIMWRGCHRCDWAVPLWQHIVGRLCDRVPVLNLASGSDYAWESPPATIEDERDRRYLQRVLGYCRLNVFRDALAHTLAATLRGGGHLLPCTAFLAAPDNPPREPPADAFVLVNYMRGAGHYDFGQRIDAEAWRDSARRLLDRLRRRHPVAFLCHDQREYDLCRDLAPEVPRFWPRRIREYWEVARRSRAAVCNRLHATVALAGLGIPAVSVGVDTRLLMVRELGLPTFYVKDSDAAALEDALESLLRREAQERERLLDLRRRTRGQYLALLGSVLSPAGP